MDVSLSSENPFTYKRDWENKENMTSSKRASLSSWIIYHHLSLSIIFPSIFLSMSTLFFNLQLLWRNCLKWWITSQILNYASEINSSPHHEDGECSYPIKMLLILQTSLNHHRLSSTCKKIAQGLVDWHGRIYISNSLRKCTVQRWSHTLNNAGD